MDITKDKWIQRHFRIVEEVASWSKDTSTKVGAVIVTNAGKPVSWGYNGMPSEVDDDVPERHERPLKYKFFEHAERNAIYNSSRGTMEDCTIFINYAPCADCARAIIAKGIKTVVVMNHEAARKLKERMPDDIAASMIMFEEAGVAYIEKDKE